MTVLGKAHQWREREINEENPETDGNEKQWFILFCHGKVKEKERDAYHYQLVHMKVRNPCLCYKDTLDEFKYLIPGHFIRSFLKGDVTVLFRWIRITLCFEHLKGLDDLWSGIGRIDHLINVT